MHPDTPDAAGSPQGKEDPEMKRCMFVDDSSVIRKVAKRILGGSDMIVIEAATGLDAVEMCAAEMPDVIVVDGALPDMQAVDVIRQSAPWKARSSRRS